MKSMILSVDDSGTMRRIIGRTAQTLGFGLLEAGNGLEALEILKSRHPDIALVLLDVNMPEMDGFETLRCIKGDDQLRSIPVMMVTTEAERGRIIEAIQAGAVNYVTKPFSAEDLATKMVSSMEMDGVEDAR